MRVQILEPAAAHATLRRMAFEVYEQNFDTQQLTLLGLGERGHHIATQLHALLQEVSPLKLELFQVEKKSDQQLHQPNSGRNWLIVDDVLYTGRTQFDTLCMLHQYAPERVQVAVLIDRGHRSFPIRPSFVGIDLATTLQEYVEVEIAENGDISASLK